MSKTVNVPQIIQKEDVAKLHFTNMEILDDPKEILQRAIDLQRATALGNTEKEKCKIYFRANEGFFRVNTTIWATTEKYVSLKEGISIPICCILRVGV